MALLLIDGQGSSSPPSLPASLPPTAAAFLADAQRAFTRLRLSLSHNQLVAADIPDTPCCIPTSDPLLLMNPLIANTNLYIHQVLRYITALENRDHDALNNLQAVGYSSGVLPALLAAASSDSSSALLANAIFLFGVAFWIGFRCQLFRRTALGALPADDPDRDAPWSLVLFGMSREQVSAIVHKHNLDSTPGAQVHVTAVTTDACVSVSGLPSALAQFRRSHVPQSTPTKPANIFTLYHAPILADAVKPAILADIMHTSDHASPSLTLKRPLRSTVSGAIIPVDTPSAELLEQALDMILVHPVNFDRVVSGIAADLAASGTRSLAIANVGPGQSLARTMSRALASSVPDVSITDISAAAPSKPSVHEPIAIVGMAVDFPGAQDAAELWKLLEEGLNTVSEIPSTRFDVSPYANTPPGAGRTLKTRFGNFIQDADVFDNAFFRISPREARSMDPQQRVLLRVAFHALENSGFVPNATPTSNPDDVGCYVGVATNDYVQNLRHDVDVHYSTGTLPAFLSGRVSYALGLSGPSVVVNTACSSSLVAIYQACRALAARDCTTALAGGVNVITSPDMYLGLDRAHFLSSTGQCKPFDESADGYCRSDGCGMFVLKRLSDALAEKDTVLGVIRGVEVNQSAAAHSITHPHAPTQARLFETLLQKSGVQAHEVNVVEAHGTGTQAGDPSELTSLRQVLCAGRGPDNPLHVTSIKGNIGHSEAASGAAGLAKLLLMLRAQAIPPQISLKNLNPKIKPLGVDGAMIATEGTAWVPGTAAARIALLNNFGAAGSNAALILSEAPKREMGLVERVDVGKEEDKVVVALSADSEAALLRLRDAYAAHVEGLGDSRAALVDFSYTATARRRMRPWRMALAAETGAGLGKLLRAATPLKVGAPRGGVVFVFSGQGGQHLGMGQGLYGISPVFRRVVDACEAKLVAWGYPGVLRVIDPRGADADSGMEKEEEIVAFQCAIFVLEYALLLLWGDWGVKPDVVVGHSLGEYVALVAAGVISIDAGLRLVAFRARLMAQKCVRGMTGMLAVRLGPESVSTILREVDICPDVSIACFNTGGDVVVGGPLEQLVKLKTHLEENLACKCLSLNVPFAYHTSAMEPILDDLTAYAAKFDFATPTIPVVSNVHGKVVQPGDASVFNAGYFARHCREPVKFDAAANDMRKLGTFDACMELGPHPTTLPMLTGLATTSLHSLHRKMSTRTSLVSSLSRLFTLRDLNWRRVFEEIYADAQCVDIPAYPFAQTSFWVAFKEEQGVVAPVGEDLKATKFWFLDAWTQRPSSRDGNISEFETGIDRLAKYITGHQVAHFALCPAAVYYELALAAATCTLERLDDAFSQVLITLSEVQFSHPLVYNPDAPVTLRTTLNLHPAGGKHAGTFTISSVLNGQELHTHCTGFFQKRPKAAAMSKLQLHRSALERRKMMASTCANGTLPETLRTRTLYDLVFSRVVQYSKTYQVIQSMTLDRESDEAIATMKLPEDRDRNSFVVHPVFIDALTHAAGFVINSGAAHDQVYICSQIDSAKIFFDALDYDMTYDIFCSTSDVSDGVIIADAWAMESTGLKRVVAHVKRLRFNKLRITSLHKLLAMATGTNEKPLSPEPPMVAAALNIVTNMPNNGHLRRPTHRAHTPSSASTMTAVNTAVDISQEVLKLVSDVSGVPLRDVKMNSNIADLGVDSLMWIELLGQLKMAYPSVSLDAAQLMLSRMVSDLVDQLSPYGDAPGKCDTPIKCQPLVKFESPLSRVQAAKPEAVQALYLNKADPSVKEVLGKILEIPSDHLQDEDDFDQLGLDSLASIEALHSLQVTFHVSLPSNFFRDYPTVGDVQTYIFGNLVTPRAPSRRSSFSKIPDCDPLVKIYGLDRTLQQLQTSRNDASPLFLVHDGSGLTYGYSRLAPLDRPVWSITNPMLLSGDAWEGGVPEMAGHYAEQVMPIVSTSDAGCILGGWSFGGVVAFHMACELQKAGVKVAGVILIDSPSPMTRSPLPDALIDAVINSNEHAPNENQSRIIDLARIQMQHSTRALVEYDPRAVADKQYHPKLVMLRCSKGFETSSIPGCGPMPFLEDRSDPKTAVADWEQLVGREVPVLDITGHHFEPFHGKNIVSLSQRLNDAISLLQ